jgi:hypothetical protein
VEFSEKKSYQHANQSHAEQLIIQIVSVCFEKKEMNIISCSFACKFMIQFYFSLELITSMSYFLFARENLRSIVNLALVVEKLLKSVA